MQLLTSDGTHDPRDPSIWEKLRLLHPQRSPPNPEQHPPRMNPALCDDAPGFGEPLIKDAILRFPRCSAAGPSGLRPSHLQDALKRKGVEIA